MSFHDIRFPASLSFGSVGGPQRLTDVVQLANGFEERNTPWAHSRRRYDAGLGMRSLDDIETMISFFEARQGQMYAFRWKDWSDYKSCPASQTPAATDQVLGYGDGARTVFALQKTYFSGAFNYARPITKPAPGTLLVALDEQTQVENIAFTANYLTGEITFATAPASGVQISAGFEFDVPVRFDTDQIQTSVASFNAGEAPDVPVVEVRV